VYQMVCAGGIAGYRQAYMHLKQSLVDARICYTSDMTTICNPPTVLPHLGHPTDQRASGRSARLRDFPSLYSPFAANQSNIAPYPAVAFLCSVKPCPEPGCTYTSLVDAFG
jgi:hypothetical protein